MSYNIKETVAKLKQISEGHLGTMADRVELDHEVQLARGQLYKIAKYAIKLHEAFKDVSEVHGLDGWVSAKITEAALAMDDVAHFMEYELSPANVANEGIEHKRLKEEEGTAADLLHKYADKFEQPQIEPKVDEDSEHNDPDDRDSYDPGMERDRTGPLERVPGYTKSERDSMTDLIKRLNLDDKMNKDPFGSDFTRGDPESEFSKDVAGQNRNWRERTREANETTPPGNSPGTKPPANKFKKVQGELNLDSDWREINPTTEPARIGITTPGTNPGTKNIARVPAKKARAAAAQKIKNVDPNFSMMDSKETPQSKLGLDPDWREPNLPKLPIASNGSTGTIPGRQGVGRGGGRTGPSRLTSSKYSDWGK